MKILKKWLYPFYLVNWVTGWLWEFMWWGWRRRTHRTPLEISQTISSGVIICSKLSTDPTFENWFVGVDTVSQAAHLTTILAKSALKSSYTVNWGAGWLLRTMLLSLTQYHGPHHSWKFSTIRFTVIIHSNLSNELTFENFCLCNSPPLDRSFFIRFFDCLETPVVLARACLDVRLEHGSVYILSVEYISLTVLKHPLYLRAHAKVRLECASFYMYC